MLILKNILQKMRNKKHHRKTFWWCLLRSRLLSLPKKNYFFLKGDICSKHPRIAKKGGLKPKKMSFLQFSLIPQVMFILATVSCTLVVLSLVHFLMALAANYAHIRGHDKFTDLAVNSSFMHSEQKLINLMHKFNSWWLLLWI